MLTAGVVTLALSAAAGIARLAFYIKARRQDARVRKAEADARVREAAKRGR